MFMQVGRTRLAIGLALFFFASFSFGGTYTNATVTVSTTVTAKCKVQFLPSSLDIGTYDPVSVNATNPKDATGIITIACVGGSAPRIDISYGQNASSSPRRLKSGSTNYLNYDLYKPTGATYSTCFSVFDVWGTGAGSGSGTGFSPSSNPSNTADQTYTICARIPGGQDPLAGSYQDSVSVTVNF
jgi:spore coat protein U-like protein